MTTIRSSSFPLVAVDIGNSRIKLGLFETQSADGELPVPSRSLTIGPELMNSELETWFASRVCITSLGHCECTANNRRTLS